MLLLSLLTNIPTIAACVTFKLIATEYRTQAAVSPCTDDKNSYLAQISNSLNLTIISRVAIPFCEAPQHRRMTL